VVTILSKVEAKTGLWILEACVWLAIIQFAVWGVVLPLAGIGRADQAESGSGWFMKGPEEALRFDLTPEGVREVLGTEAQLPESGQVVLDGVTLTPTVTAEVVFARPGWADFLATTGSSLVVGITGAGVALLVLLVVRSVRTGSPFSSRNVRLMYWAGVATMIGGTVNMAVTAVGSFAAAARPAVEELVYPSALLEFGFVALGAVFIVMAEVFRRGLALLRETEGLV
jgi:hypothetical protein